MIEILQSTRPEWCAKTFSGEKKVEVRKTRPKANPPYRVFVYETVNGGGSGLVIGEYICNDLFPIWPGYKKADTCLTNEQMEAYLGDNGMGWGWNITQPVLYGIPKELSEYEHYKASGGGWLRLVPLERAPQSWCYVEEEKR